MNGKEPLGERVMRAETHIKELKEGLAELKVGQERIFKSLHNHDDATIQLSHKLDQVLQNQATNIAGMTTKLEALKTDIDGMKPHTKTVADLKTFSLWSKIIGGGILAIFGLLLSIKGYIVINWGPPSGH